MDKGKEEDEWCRGGSRLRTDPQRKEQKWEVME